MKKRLIVWFGFGGLLVLASMIVSPVAQALEGKILARVNGQPIYDWEIKLAEEEIGEALAQVAADKRRTVLLRYVIDTRLMALAGVKAGVEKSQVFQRRTLYGKHRALRDAYFQKMIGDSITEKMLREIYDREIKKVKPGEEVKARHILVKKEEDALEIIEQLNRGEEFTELAKEKSTGPSGSNGGDLGYFSKGRMVKSFEEAAFALKPGEISAPVKSSFGWHIIKVEDRRMTPVAKFEDLKGQIRSQLVQQKSRQITSDLRKNGQVELLDKELAKQFKLQE